MSFFINFYKTTRKWYRQSPFGKTVPKYWTKPSDEQYQLDLHYDGFISPDHLQEYELHKNPAIMEDLETLERYLLPIFWEYNQKSRHFQNKYFFYQWVFIIGAFLTTVSGVITTYFSGLGEDTSYGVWVLFFYFSTWTKVGLMSVTTTIISAITSYFTLLSNQGEPRKRWASYRRLAEELRIVYFRYVARLEPYNTKSRVEVLRRRMIEIREQEQASV